MAAFDEYSAWHRQFFPEIAIAGGTPDREIIFNLAAPFLGRYKPIGRVPSQRALALVTGMVNFVRPGTMTSPTFAAYWLGGLMDAAGLDADAEWLVKLNDKINARDWVGALAMVKARGSGGTATPAPAATLGQVLAGVIGSSAVSALKAAL